MAKDAPAVDTADPFEGVEWETLNTGLGTAWDFDKASVLTGRYFDRQTVMTDDPQNPGQQRESDAFRFQVHGSDDLFFVWGSATLEMAFLDRDGNERVRAGEPVRITYLGRDSFTGKNGPQQIKRYRVQVAKPPEHLSE